MYILKKKIYVQPYVFTKPGALPKQDRTEIHINLELILKPFKYLGYSTADSLRLV